MSVIHKKSNGGASTEIEKEVREVKAAGEQTAALLALSFKAQIVQDRAAGTNVISDAAILQSAEVIEYDEYADNHAYNTVGEIIKHNGRYYEIPGLPYDWMSYPPSVNRVLGIWWLGNLLYPELYDYDMVQVAQEYYRLFWHYDLTEEEARQMLSRSTLK